MNPTKLYELLRNRYPQADWNQATEKVWTLAFTGINPLIAEKTVMSYNTREEESPIVAEFFELMETIEKTAREDQGYQDKPPEELASLRKYHIAEARAFLASLETKSQPQRSNA